MTIDNGPVICYLAPGNSLHPQPTRTDDLPSLSTSYGISGAVCGARLRNSAGQGCGPYGSRSRTVPCKTIGPPSPHHPSQRSSLAPASGYRHTATGALGGIGVEGTALSSSPLASGHNNASRILFNAGNVGPFNGTNRAYALSVRCVQASAGPLFPGGKPNMKNTEGETVGFLFRVVSWLLSGCFVTRRQRAERRLATSKNRKTHASRNPAPHDDHPTCGPEPRRAAARKRAPQAPTRKSIQTSRSPALTFKKGRIFRYSLTN